MYLLPRLTWAITKFSKEQLMKWQPTYDFCKLFYKALNTTYLSLVASWTNQCLVHILLPVTDNCPSWTSRRGRMPVEIISWPISTKVMWPGWGLNINDPWICSHVCCWLRYRAWPIWATLWENLFIPYANNKGADQPAHPCSLISAFIVCCLDSIILLLTVSQISRL